jgi:hypothetical protein
MVELMFDGAAIYRQEIYDSVDGVCRRGAGPKTGPCGFDRINLGEAIWQFFPRRGTAIQWKP